MTSFHVVAFVISASIFSIIAHPSEFRHIHDSILNLKTESSSKAAESTEVDDSPDLLRGIIGMIDTCMSACKEDLGQCDRRAWTLDILPELDVCELVCLKCKAVCSLMMPTYRGP